MNMFNNKLVVAIKNEGKVLKEIKDGNGGMNTYLPFGAEYSIFVKNLNSVRAAVRIEIDGKSVTDGQDLIIQGNSSIDIERFIKNGNLSSGNKFKFIERTGKVEAHRGVQAEDGLVRVEFQFEKVKPAPIVVETVHTHVHHDYYRPWYTYPYYWGGGYCGSPTYVNGGCHGIIGNSNEVLFGSASNGFGSAEAASYTLTTSNAGNGQGSVTSQSFSAPAGGAQAFVNNISTPQPTNSILRSRSMKKLVSTNETAEVNDAGITVAGSESNQQFRLVDTFDLESEKHVIVLKLLGGVGDKQVKKAVVVRQKQTCTSCGTRNRGQNKCCRECGTALEII